MQDDTTNTEVVEEVVADEPQVETSEEVTTQPETEAPVAEEVEQAPAEEETTVEETEKPPSRREQLRIQQLLQKYGPPPERPTQQQAPSKQVDALDYRTALNADDEVVQTLESDRQAYGKSQYEQGESQALKQVNTVKWETLLNIDAPQVESKYPVLNPNDKEHFHPALADTMSRLYFNTVGYDPNTGFVDKPNVRWSEFVESYMEFAEEIASTKNQETVKNVTKQAAQTGLRPDGSSAPRMNLNKAPQDMTIDELYASLGQKPPKK